MDAIESLPLFPLPDVVLLPEISVPLILFEPRYRQLARDVLAGSRQIGMVALRPDSVALIAGDPPTFEIGCLGRVAHAQERADGSYQILLLGVRRFRILQEEERSAERLYRSARVELLSDETPEDEAARALLQRRRGELLQHLERLVQRLDETDARNPAVAAFDRLEPANLINALTQSLALQPVERQRLLESDSIIGRFEIMGELLRFRLAEIHAGVTDSAPLPN